MKYEYKIDILPNLSEEEEKKLEEISNEGWEVMTFSPVFKYEDDKNPSSTKVYMRRPVRKHLSRRFEKKDCKINMKAKFKLIVFFEALGLLVWAGLYLFESAKGEDTGYLTTNALLYFGTISIVSTFTFIVEPVMVWWFNE